MYTAYTMASRNFIILLAAIAVLLPATAMATKFWVGDKAGWTIDYDYQAWAKDKVFHLGDTLIFVYQKGNDSVYKANQTEFLDCIVPEGTPGLTSGHDEITLTTPGKRWYISGAPYHCSEYKQKLAIYVMPGGALAPSALAPWAHAPHAAWAPAHPMAPMTPTPAVTAPGSHSNSAGRTHQGSNYQALFVAAIVFAAFLMA